MTESLSANPAFSLQQPALQLAIDSTSLGEFKICPRRYQYTMIEGWRPKAESVHLTFGILLHRARELYDKVRFTGESHESSVELVVWRTLCETWNSELQRPWASDHKTKNRLTLVRSIVWYLDEKAKDDPLQTVELANGRPAVELSFQFDSGLRTTAGERWLLCGHLDRIAKLNGVPYIVDIKTTAHSLDPSYFAQYSPDNQFSLYVFAGQIVYEQPIAGLVVDAIQVGTSFSRCQRGLVQRSREQLDEWMAATAWWLHQLERCAVQGDWPQNDKACNLFGGCQFRSVCSRSPHSRQQWLETDFKRRQWNPLEKRGEI